MIMIISIYFCGISPTACCGLGNSKWITKHVCQKHRGCNRSLLCDTSKSYRVLMGIEPILTLPGADWVLPSCCNRTFELQCQQPFRADGVVVGANSRKAQDSCWAYAFYHRPHSYLLKGQYFCRLIWDAPNIMHLIQGLAYRLFRHNLMYICKSPLVLTQSYLLHLLLC